jgi:hypothetical protein
MWAFTVALSEEAFLAISSAGPKQDFRKRTLDEAAAVFRRSMEIFAMRSSNILAAIKPFHRSPGNHFVVD